MVEILGAPASIDDVRAIARRRKLDETALSLSLKAADLGRAWAARDQTEIVGIAIAHDSQDERYIGDCYVEASYRTQGVGSGLLAAALDDAQDRARTMLLDSNDRAAARLAYRYGMALRQPILRFAGTIPREEELAKMAAGEYRFGVEPIDSAAHGMALNELDRQTRGTIRPADHASFARDASGSAFSLNGELIGYAYVWPDGCVGPSACASEVYLVQIFAYALVTLQRVHRASWCTVLVPGSNRRIARASLRAGLRIQDVFTIASDAPLSDLSTYIGRHQLLF
ncbi:MAG: GNAT family N-acetyltransferase [Candidatus Cybelea sp.]